MNDEDERILTIYDEDRDFSIDGEGRVLEVWGV